MLLKPWPASLLLAALLALASCSRTQPDPAPISPPASRQDPAASLADSFDSTWQGVLPCTDCDGIQTRLRLFVDGQDHRFELRETYLASDGGEVFEGQGEWAEETVVLDGRPTVVYRLDADGASRWFSLQPDGALEMRDDRERPTADGLAHRLQRM